MPTEPRPDALEAFEVAHEEVGDVRVVRLAGELGLESKDRFDAIWRDAVTQRRPTVLDLSGVGFMDSTALSTLLTALRDAWGSGQALLVAGPLQSPVASLLAISGVDRFLVVHPDVATAFAELGAPADPAG